MKTHRYPRVGIRPTIDGRLGGVRESLEEQTMAMARAAAELISSALHYPDGTPVECIIAETTIGGVVEAAACARQFAAENVGVSLTVTRCWCYGSETMDMTPHIPRAVRGFNGTERPGAVYLAAVLAAYTQKGIPAFGIYGRDVQDLDDLSIPEDVREKLLRFVRSGMAVAIMRGQAYLSVGGTSMGIAGSMVNHDFLEGFLGMRVEAIDSSEILRRIDRKIYDEEKYEKALAWTKANCLEGKDENSPATTRNRAALDMEWEKSVKMALIMKDLMAGNPALAKKGFGEESCGHHALVAGFQGQRQWTDYQPNGDYMEAILNTSFDWDGPRAPFIVATENDHLNGISMLFNYLLTNTAQIFADVRTYWSPESVHRITGYQLQEAAAGGLIHLINSGPATLDGTGGACSEGQPMLKPYWEISDNDMRECLKMTQWHPSITEYFPGGGWSTSYRSRGNMPMTMCRINLIKGLGPALQIAEGTTVDLPETVHASLNERTNSTWPTTWFAPRLTGRGAFYSVYDVMHHWGANHAAISYGHIGADLIALASLLRIPVYMHNVDEEKLLRPSAWNAFGTADRESADFRACASFGPLYR